MAVEVTASAVVLVVEGMVSVVATKVMVARLVEVAAKAEPAKTRAGKTADVGMTVQCSAVVGAR